MGAAFLEASVMDLFQRDCLPRCLVIVGHWKGSGDGMDSGLVVFAMGILIYVLEP